MKKTLTTIAAILVVAFISSVFLNAQGARTYAGDKDKVAYSIQKASKATGIRQLFQEKSDLSPSRHQISEASAGGIYGNAGNYSTQSMPAWIPVTGNAHNMISYGNIYKDSVLINGAGYYLVSFGPAGEADCRSAGDVSSGGSYYATIRGDTNGETISFKIYEPGTDTVYDIQQTLPFQPDEVNADFDLIFTTFASVTISGKITHLDHGEPDCIIDFSGGESPVYTGADGTYSKTLNAGWSGTVTCTGEHCTFTPPSRTYSNVFSDIPDQDYTAIRTIYAPLNFNCQKVLNRSLSQEEYINVITWEANPDNENIVKYRIYQVEGETQSLLVELNADTFLYWHRNVEKDKQYTYDLVAVDDEGREGVSVNTTTQGTAGATGNLQAGKTAIGESGSRLPRGDTSGKDDPKTAFVASNKPSRARSTGNIYSPLNFNGQKTMDRSLSQVEYINEITWAANPGNENIAKYRIYRVEGETQSLLAELNADTFSYRHRKVDKDRQYTYALAAVNNKGVEGLAAFITVQ